MTMTIEEIQDALTAVLDGAEGRDLTDEEVATFEGLERDLEAAQAQRTRTEELRARNEQRKAVATKPLFVEAKPERDTLSAAFQHYMRTGQANADISQLRAAQGEGTGSSGGYLVPDEFRQKLVDRMKAFGGIANVVETITTSTGATMEWPTLDDTGNVGEIVAEHGTFAGGADLTFGSANLGAYKYMAGGTGGTPLRISVELLQDAAFDIEGLVSRKLGERIARVQAPHLVTGTGSSQPQGILDGLTGVGLFSGTSDALTYADLLNAVHSLDPAYREGGSCRWAFNDASLETIRGLLDGNNRPILKSGDDSAATGAGGATLLGYPVTIDQAFPNASPTSATVNWGVFGDLREGYVIRRVRDVVLVVNPWTRAANGQVEYSCWARMDAVQQNTNAYVALTGTA